MRTDYSASFYTGKMDILSLTKSARKVWLSTHIAADGDGLGSEMAFFHALKKMSVDVQIIHNDPVPERYSFLTQDILVHQQQNIPDSLLSSDDLIIVFDTNDPKICRPLVDRAGKIGMKILFVDHHIEQKKPVAQAQYFIDESASCTGELTMELIRKLGVPLDQQMASCLYTSLLFDTQSFKSMRNPAKVLRMAQILIDAGADHKSIYSSLFENWTINKLNYLAKLIDSVEYKNPSTAVIRMSLSDLKEYQLSSDEVSDIVDLFMGLKNLNISIVVREESEQYYKLSFRSRKNEILSWAREFGGGGHLFSAGAWVTDSEKNIMARIDALIVKS